MGDKKKEREMEGEKGRMNKKDKKEEWEIEVKLKR